MRGICTVEAGSGGFSHYTLSHASGSSVVVTDYGAHLLSWRDARGGERLFVSEKALFAPGKPIRGGIPLVFPQFGKGDLPSHGFARTSVWTFEGSSITEHGAITATFSLSWKGGVDSIWPHPCELRLHVKLSDVLAITMSVKNTGEAPLSFFSALHTYYRVSDIKQVAIEGLCGVDYIDFLRDRIRECEGRASVRCDGATDRVYVNSPRKLILRDDKGVPMIIDKQGMSDTVVWNPWREGAQTIVDLDCDEFQNFICVESGNVVTPIVLNPGEEHVAQQTLGVQLD